jgi:hypothetical protein
MPEHRLIRDYREALRAALPARVAEEVADGLAQTYDHHLERGLSPDDAARAALAEFGDPDVVLVAFTQASPVRRAARGLMLIGPAVGTCWAAALISGHAWDWRVPALALAAAGLTLVGLITLMVTAAFARGYRFVRRAGTAACAGFGAFDASAISVVVLAAPGVRWPAAAAACASAVRLVFVARAIRPLAAR